MRFYSGDHVGLMNHHDIALVENEDLPAPPADWTMFVMPVAINHTAITMPSLGRGRAGLCRGPADRGRRGLGRRHRLPDRRPGAGYDLTPAGDGYSIHAISAS
jgi:hypothetical protein